MRWVCGPGSGTKGTQERRGLEPKARGDYPESKIARRGEDSIMPHPIRKSGGRPHARVACLLGTVLVTLVVFSGGSNARADEIFRIATASKAGTFYPIGKLIAQGISAGNDCGTMAAPCGVPGLLAVAQVSNGSVANVETVSSEGIEAGLAQADVIYWAYNGTGRFSGRPPLTRLRAIANLFPGSLHIVTSANSGIRRVDDLRGKRVALDEPGSGTLATAELILSSVNIGKDELSPLYIKHNHAGPMLVEGNVDAFFFVAGYPTRSVVDVVRRIDTHLVPLGAATIESLIGKRPYFASGSIPAGTYAGMDTDTATVDIGTQLIVNETLDERRAYEITAALWSKRTRKLLDEGHPKGAQVRLESALRGVAIPLHPGAARFYREAGILKN